MIPSPSESKGFQQIELSTKVGVVIIGRNEGLRLKRCLESIETNFFKTVYVDSGSTDLSVNLALNHGADVVELDMSVPFCAARARNAGYRRLNELVPRLNYVQFIDGDCELARNWLSFATEALLKRPDHAIVVGWLKEKFPEHSIYNLLGDLEWNFTGSGPVEAVGGIFMIRCEAFDSVNGFDSTVAVGEEPELCQRLSQKGWKITKFDHDMAFHDLAMTRFTQWWRRTVRNGYGSMDVASRFKIPKFVQMNLRAQFWFLWLVATLAICYAGSLPSSSPVIFGLIFLTACVWPARFLRIAIRTFKKGQPIRTSAIYAFFMLISFAPQITGQMLYFIDRLRNRKFRLLEYKVTDPPSIKKHR